MGSLIETIHEAQKQKKSVFLAQCGTKFGSRKYCHTAESDVKNHQGETFQLQKDSDKNIVIQFSFKPLV